MTASERLTIEKIRRDYKLESGELPRHVAVIMDGNGRWAQSRGWPRILGHREGAERVRELTRFCGQLGIPYLTLYTFSTENWQRPAKEVRFLMSLLERYLSRLIDELDQEGVRLNVMGDISSLPRSTQGILLRSIDRLSKNQRLVLTLALSYSGRSEIVRAAKTLAHKVEQGLLQIDSIDEQDFGDCLESSSLPDPELMIRTSGELRLSNFMLWQMAYTELVFSPDHWPDFRCDQFVTCLQQYQSRHRRFGNVDEDIVSESVEALPRETLGDKACSSREF